MTPVSVSPSPVSSVSTRSALHRNTAGTRFVNPWPSFRPPGLSQMLQALSTFPRPTVPPQIEQLMRLQSPHWGAAADPCQLKATWLGHACFLVELPTPPGAARGPRVLFDPSLSERCSPFSWIGPTRFTPTPCTLPELPEVDIIVYSHNHYDHLDTTTLRALISPLSPPRQHIFAPLNNDSLFRSLSIPATHVHCLDWWEARLVSVELPSLSPSSDTDPSAAPPTIRTSFRLTCTPCQHLSSRGVLDRFATLWSSWALESGVAPDADADVDADPAAPPRRTLWFGGDTGYRTVRDGENEDEVPTCPAFAEIGEHFGGFDLALIPIGAYEPRAAFSAFHCAPQDSVRVFQDVKARRAVGMHWGTWRLTSEPVMAPAQLLAEECAKAGLSEGVFGVCGIGETVIA